MTNDPITEDFLFSYPLFFLHSTELGPFAVLKGPSGLEGDCLFVFTDSDLAERYRMQTSKAGQLSISSLNNCQEFLGFLAIQADAKLASYFEFDPVIKSGPRIMLAISKMIEILEPQVEREFPE